jgi:Sensors of blue-light using FAD
MLVRCLYASRATKPIADGVLDAILKQSRRNNPGRGITGMLCHANDIFVQVLEGGRTDVSRLLTRIVADERHRDIEILSLEEIAERRFGCWTMGQVNLATSNAALLLRFSEKAELNPFTLTAAATMALVNEFAAAGAIANRGA